ncbi:MAG: NAD(P)/FAD-dependent oxidoreductase [Tannerella sp.]|jgi:NADH dehydrogenase|nr:NAD(P)/FAD-dependent oxidoreductase [Tannerella sp.]
MKRIANIPDKKDLKRIVIVGGGFAGHDFAKKINKKKYQVVLIDKVNYYQFQPLMYQVATAGLEPSSISYPHRKSFQKQPDFHFRTCEALKVNPSEHHVDTTIGEICYDYLVIATGCDTNYFGNDELKCSTYALKNVSESLLMRNRILLSFEQATNTDQEDELERMLTFVIVGGGATGVELSGALAEMKKTILPKDYPDLDAGKMKIYLIDSSPRLLNAMSESASAATTKALEKRGVIIRKAMVLSYEDDVVKMDNGEELHSQNVFWVAGVKPNSIGGLQEESYMKGRLLVDEYNRVKGYDHIYCIGDTALMITDAYPKGHPQVAQPALQMAANLAANLNREIKGNIEWKRFDYKNKGSLATIGRNSAVADLGKFRFSGQLAWWLWLLIHILSIIGMRNKFSVFIDWVWNYITYDVSLRLLIFPKLSSIYKKDSKTTNNCN